MLTCTIIPGSDKDCYKLIVDYHAPLMGGVDLSKEATRRGVPGITANAMGQVKWSLAGTWAAPLTVTAVHHAHGYV